MKTTVSATFFMLLAAYECSAQYYYRPGPFQPVWSAYGMSNNQYLGAGSYQPSLSQQTQNTGYSPTSQNQPGQPSSSRPSADSALVTDRIVTNSPLGPWATPDSRIESTRSPTTQRLRSTKPTATSGPWQMPSQKPVVEQAVDAFLGAKTTVRKRRRTTSMAPPLVTNDVVKYPAPGANVQGTTYNSLETLIGPDEPDSASEINSGLRQFALDMLMDMTTGAPGKNVVISPYSIWAVMLVIYEGAEGQTAKQISKTLMFKDNKAKVRKNYKRLEHALQKANHESHSDFVSGNGIFFDDKRPLMPDFEQIALSFYQCDLRPVNFSNPLSAVMTINDWVAEVTRKRIKTLVKPDDINRPELIITNALFFKGQWKIPFNLSATHQDKFYDEQKRHVADVRMMYQKGAYMYSFINEIGAHVLDMPYEDDKFRMLVVLPKPTSTVAEVLRLMKLFPVDQCYERLVREQEMFSEDEVHVYLPRFKFGNRVEVRPNLQRLGITDVFSNRANLSSMSMLPLALGKVFHVSEIEVNEEGTIASAATAGGFVNKMGPPKFLANRPFAYFIVENSLKTVIFAGKVADPTKKWN